MNKKYRLRKVIQRHTPSPDLTAFHIELFDCGRSEEDDCEFERKRLPIGRMKYHRESSIQRQFRSATNTPLFTPATEAFLRDLEAQTPAVEEEELSICLDDLSLENGESTAAPEIIVSKPEVQPADKPVDDFFGAGDIDPTAGVKKVEKELKSDSSDTSSDDDEFESADKDKDDDDESNEASCIPKFGGGFDPMQERTISIPTSATNTHNSDSTDAEDSVATIKDTVSIDVKESISENPVIVTASIVEEDTVKETKSAAPAPLAYKPTSPSPQAPPPVETKQIPTLTSAQDPLPASKEPLKPVTGSDSSVVSEPSEPISTTASDASATTEGEAPRPNTKPSLDNVNKPLEAISTMSPETPSSPKSVRFATES